MRASREQNACRALVLGLLALAAACASSRSGQRDAPAADAVAIPVAEATLAPAREPERPPARPPADAPPMDTVQRMLSSARAELGKRGGREGIDCSTFVRAAYSAAGVDLYAEASPRDNGVQAIRRYVRRHGRLHRRRQPAPGDLVFFDNSYDRNRNRLLDDRLTHVGIVEEVLADGTALVLHSTNHGVVREPTPRFMAELFAGFGTVFGAEHPARPAARRPARAARCR